MQITKKYIFLLVLAFLVNFSIIAQIKNNRIVFPDKDLSFNKFVDIVEKNPAESATVIKDRIIDGVRNFSQTDILFDDVTIVVIKIN